MLTTLRIENLAIIDELEIRFGTAMNVLSGETGAGKSIIVGALGLVLGARADTEAVRQGAAEGRVEALFAVPPDSEVHAALDERGLPASDGELLVQRVLSRAGRNRVYINGALATTATLQAVTGPLVDVSGQHEQWSLLNPRNHSRILDQFGGLGAERADVATRYRGLVALRGEVQALDRAESDRAAREDFLRFQLDELDRAAVTPGEDERLQEEVRLLRNAATLRESAGAVYDLLYDAEEAVTVALDRAVSRLSRLADLDGRVQPLSARLEAARIDIEDVAQELAHYRDRIESDPARLAQHEDRLDLLHRLARKHGGDVAAVLCRHAAIRAELGQLTSCDERRAALRARIAAEEADLLARAVALSEKRRAAAQSLERIVADGLAALSMERARLRVALGDRGRTATALTEDGLDVIEFAVATNVGEGEKPLARSASGGELSRILLALKRALRHTHDAATHVFDEVDTGVGGAVAEAVGRLLADTAEERQVIVITHLPQVASFAADHFRVEKVEHDGRTVTRVRPLDEAEHVAEVARMLAGARVTETTLLHAAEMVRTARTRSLSP